MGQKVNPIGLRIGIIREWDAKWYAPKTKVADLLHEDLKIRKFLNSNCYNSCWKTWSCNWITRFKEK